MSNNGRSTADMMIVMIWIIEAYVSYKVITTCNNTTQVNKVKTLELNYQGWFGRTIILI